MWCICMCCVCVSSGVGVYVVCEYVSVYGVSVGGMCV